MGNMSYCRFENTFKDLEIILDHINDKLSETEDNYRNDLLQLCRDILDEYDEEIASVEE